MYKAFIWVLLFLSLQHTVSPQQPDESEPFKVDLYETLGVNKAATLVDIQKAYHQLAKQWHPDRNKDPIAEDKFVKIAEAYEILSDSQQRRFYDLSGSTKGSGPRSKSAGRFSLNRLIVSCMSGDTKKFEKLLSRGRDPGGKAWDLDEKGMMGFTALHWAAKKGAADIVELLASAGATIDSRAMKAPAGGNTKAGAQTPLMGAAKAGAAKVVDILLAHGADASLVAGDGKSTAVDFACDVQGSPKDFRETVISLIAAGTKAPRGCLDRMKIDENLARFKKEIEEVQGKGPRQAAGAGVKRKGPKRAGFGPDGKLLEPISQPMTKGGGGMDKTMFAKLLAIDKHKARDSSAIFAELDVDNDGLLSSAEFTEMAKLANLERHEL